MPLLLAVIALAVLAVVLGSGGSAHRTAAKHRVTVSKPVKHRHHVAKEAGSRANTAATTTPATSAPPTSAAASTPPTTSAANTTPPAAPMGGGLGSPVTSVEHFYWDAAAHRYPAAWALADPAFRQQLGGYDSFVAGQSGDRQIIFDSTQLVSHHGDVSTVAIRTTSIRDNGTQHCGGTVELVHAGGPWLLHQIQVNCS